MQIYFVSNEAPVSTSKPLSNKTLPSASNTTLAPLFITTGPCGFELVTFVPAEILFPGIYWMPVNDSFCMKTSMDPLPVLLIAEKIFVQVPGLVTYSVFTPKLYPL